MDLISGIALGNAAIAGIGAYGAKKASASPNDERLQATIEQLQREIEVLKKAKEICESKSVPEPAPIPEAVPEPPAPEPAPIPEPVPEPEAEQREVKQDEIDQCKQRLDSLRIRTLGDYRKWMAKNRGNPDIPMINNCVDIVLKGRTGGLRKKKLRTRRVGKQKNVRRTRRS